RLSRQDLRPAPRVVGQGDARPGRGRAIRGHRGLAESHGPRSRPRPGTWTRSRPRRFHRCLRPRPGYRHRGPRGGSRREGRGAGRDRPDPPENARLAERIGEEGALVSEFPFGTAPFAGNFPRRNRVIAGWAAGVVVAEATEKSGALGTARHAQGEGRDVMA